MFDKWLISMLQEGVKQDELSVFVWGPGNNALLYEVWAGGIPHVLPTSSPRIEMG